MVEHNHRTTFQCGMGDHNCWITSPMDSLKILPPHNWFHPFCCGGWRPSGGELLHGAVQVSQLCLGLPHHQAGHEPHPGNHPSRVSIDHSLYSRLWITSREVAQSGLTRGLCSSWEWWTECQDTNKGAEKDISKYFPFWIWLSVMKCVYDSVFQK